MIELANVSKTYRHSKVAVSALSEVSLTIQPGEFVAIMGPSGSGKSTLLHILGLLDRPDSGGHRFWQRDVNRLDDDALAALRNSVIGFVFQQFFLLGRVSALENTELPLIYAGRRKFKEKAQRALAAVGLGQRIGHKPNELSGGEQQRVAIARSLVNDPVVIFADEPTGNLDTESAGEIMKILTGLNDQGITIIMVTHERDIACHAGRIISMRDGKIISDESGSTDKIAASDKEINCAKIIQEKHSSLGKIEFIDHIRQAYHAIVGHKLRSFLSMLGILIGVGAVIAMLAIGQGAKQAIEQRLRSLGSNLLSVRGGSARVRGVATQAGSVTRFTPADITAVKELPVISRASGYVRGSGQMVYGNENWRTRVEGVGYDYGNMRYCIPVVGSWFTREQIRKRAKVIILGVTVAQKLFGEENPVGKQVKLNRINFQVIGILPKKGGSHWGDRDDVVVIPVTTAMYRVLGKNYLDSFYAEVVSDSLMKEAEDDIRRLLIKRHRLNKNNEDSFHIRDMEEIQEMIAETTKTIGLLLGCIAAISLLVGGIGIMNIMLVSVTERTREIGLRKAVGARSRDIMAQFLIESIVMSIIGGLLGICLGALVSFTLSTFAGWATIISFSSIVLATTFSAAVGVGFGLWPAKKAARLNPVESLRYE